MKTVDGKELDISLMGDVLQEFFDSVVENAQFISGDMSSLKNITGGLLESIKSSSFIIIDDRFKHGLGSAGTILDQKYLEQYSQLDGTALRIVDDIPKDSKGDIEDIEDFYDYFETICEEGLLDSSVVTAIVYEMVNKNRAFVEDIAASVIAGESFETTEVTRETMKVIYTSFNKVAGQEIAKVIEKIGFNSSGELNL